MNPAPAHPVVYSMWLHKVCPILTQNSRLELFYFPFFKCFQLLVFSVALASSEAACKTSDAKWKVISSQKKESNVRSSFYLTAYSTSDFQYHELQKRMSSEITVVHILLLRALLLSERSPLLGRRGCSLTGRLPSPIRSIDRLTSA